ncbi:hypothetical protein BpHYR1_032636 [Brachionus plicatilis]|uniref:Ataxin-10 domain-containing protein n=1 Tax=Brachionus plicatilis TaxID=10195 RepID=A0A3M7Q2E9_BRAPC|nr:hypothetical protein BpHYR1_032636 [Brachionus plicatilis]
MFLYNKILSKFFARLNFFYYSMEILNKLDGLSPGNQNFEILLTDLDTYIKQNEDFRRQTPSLFYTILYQKLSTIFHSDQKKWTILRQLMKCIKNSAASFKTEFSQEECHLCDELVQIIDRNLFVNSQNADQNEFHFYLNILQYIFNLVQGNRTALDKRSISWTNLALDLIKNQNLDTQVTDISSMIIINAFKYQENSDQLYENIFCKFDFVNFVNLVESVEEKFKNEPLSTKFSNWTFKLLDKMFDFFYLKYLVESDIKDLSKRFRFFLIYHISDRILDAKDAKIQRTFLNFKSLEFMCRIYTFTFQALLGIFEQILEKPFEEVIDSFKQTKLIAGILSDLLTLEETRLFNNNQMVLFVQDQDQLFKSTCKLFKEINCSRDYASLVERYSKSEFSEWLLLKCELVRMIGILVYDNQRNQNYLVNDQLLQIIAGNLNLDVENPFLREWNIIALKHILCQLDKK